MLRLAQSKPPLSPCIVHIGSVAGQAGSTGQAVYAASKAGLVGLTKAMAVELGPKNIRVNMVAPGFIATDMTRSLPADRATAIVERTPLRSWGQPSDIAEAVEVRVLLVLSFPLLFLYSSTPTEGILCAGVSCRNANCLKNVFSVSVTRTLRHGANCHGGWRAFGSIDII